MSRATLALAAGLPIPVRDRSGHPRGASVCVRVRHAGLPATPDEPERRRLIAALRRPEVREAGQVGGVGVGEPVGDRRRRRVGLYDGIDQWICQPRDRSQLDRHDVVEHTAAVGESGRISGEKPDRIRILDGCRNRHVQPQLVGIGRSRVVLEAGHDPGGQACQQDRDEVCTSCGERLRDSGTPLDTEPAAGPPAPDAGRLPGTHCHPPA